MADEKIMASIEEEKDHLKLVSDSSYPLLQKFRETCPGTFKHSQTVASMVEGISTSLGLDINTMKVAALYHDIGKMVNPKYFTENQMSGEENPHDKLDPWVSFQIISRHVADGVNLLLNDDNFPRKIIQIISQHHGNNVVKYFFDKSGTEVEDLYRYRGTLPVDIESAVLMICDHVEAISKSKIQHGNFDPKQVIDSTVAGLIDEGQLDNVYMRLGDLKKIKDGLAQELQGMYQKRVDYGEAAKEAVAVKESE